MSAYHNFVRVVKDRLDEEGTSPRAAALRAGLPVRSIRSILEGHVPSLERAGEVANALGIQFEIGTADSRKPDCSGGALTPRQIRALADTVGTLYRVLLIAALRSGLPLPSVRDFVERHGPFRQQRPDDDPELFMATGSEPNSFSALASELAETIELKGLPQPLEVTVDVGSFVIRNQRAPEPGDKDARGSAASGPRDRNAGKPTETTGRTTQS